MLDFRPEISGMQFFNDHFMASLRNQTPLIQIIRCMQLLFIRRHRSEGESEVPKSGCHDPDFRQPQFPRLDNVFKTETQPAWMVVGKRRAAHAGQFFRQKADTVWQTGFAKHQASIRRDEGAGFRRVTAEFVFDLDRRQSCRCADIGLDARASWVVGAECGRRLQETSHHCILLQLYSRAL